MRSKLLLAAIILGAVLLGFFDYPKKIQHVPHLPYRLGLDLQGGTHLVYQGDLSQIGDQSASDAMEGVRDVIERRVNLFGVSEPVVQVEGRDHVIVELAGISDVNEAIDLIGQTPFLEFREIGSGVASQSFVPTGLTGKHLESAQLEFDPNTGRAVVSLNLTDEGGTLFGEITKRNIGKPIAIFLDGEIISAPIVESEITTGKAQISGGGITPASAKELAQRLNAGALPVPIKLISQQTIGASLGKESLDKSLKAGLYALLAVALFMILYYRLPGVASVIALAVYLLIVLAIYKIIPVTLTLAGIAGFILSLGIAVDANVLIFARLREELAAGRTLQQAVDEGFRRAWMSIRDSHVTTLLGALILYLFTTSIVKGFALTLGIGVLLSLFSSIVVTRAFLNLVVHPSVEKHRWLF